MATCARDQILGRNPPPTPPPTPPDPSRPAAAAAAAAAAAWASTALEKLQLTSLSPESLLLEHSESGRLPALSRGELRPTPNPTPTTAGSPPGDVSAAKGCEEEVEEEEGEVRPRKLPPS